MIVAEKILYVDDEPINLLLFDKLFSKKYNVITAHSGHEGLEKLLLNSDVKLVVSDMKMPLMNGLDFVALAKKHNPKLGCFILTGYDITSEISVALKQNLIQQYFRKPFNEKELLAAFDNWFSENNS